MCECTRIPVHLNMTYMDVFIIVTMLLIWSIAFCCSGSFSCFETYQTVCFYEDTLRESDSVFRGRPHSNTH